MNSFGLDSTCMPKIAVIGGSGFCTFPELSVVKSLKIDTLYGKPSNDIIIGKCGEEMIAFLPRHGEKHTLPPHKIPYKANVAALKELGVEYIFSTCIAGSLKHEIPPGSMVIIDQFVNLTWGRDDYFEIDGKFIHLPMAIPYCESLRKILIETADSMGLVNFSRGTVVVIQGPRFSTIAESRWFINNGWDVVNMTQYPECYFAREFGICYATIALITDYDVGTGETLSMDPANMDVVLKMFQGNICKLKDLIIRVLAQETVKNLSCKCSESTARYCYAR